MTLLICSACNQKFGIGRRLSQEKYYCPYCGCLDTVADEDEQED